MNYQTVRNLQFRPLFRTSLRSIYIDLRDTEGEIFLYVSVGNIWLVLKSKKLPIFIFNEKDVTRWLLWDKYRFHTIELLVVSVEENSVHLSKLLGE